MGYRHPSEFPNKEAETLAWTDMDDPNDPNDKAQTTILSRPVSDTR